MAVKVVYGWLARVGTNTLFVEPDSPWKDGDRESFNGKLRDELLDGELFDRLNESERDNGILARTIPDRGLRLTSKDLTGFNIEIVFNFSTKELELNDEKWERGPDSKHLCV